MSARPPLQLAHLFHAPVAAWFEETFQEPTRAQALGWPAIAASHSTLVFAPTGSGKTLAAFLAAIDRLMFAPPPDQGARCRVLYVSPLRALAVDVERNLRVPLAGIARAAERLGVPFHVPEVGLRTGDTPAGERRRLARTPPDILITTPESLYLMLTSEARRVLASVVTLIVDEIHALVATKRGAHLALSVERLAALHPRELQRIGLSATQRPLDEVARYLGGHDPAGPRPVSIVDARGPKTLELRVEVPVEDLGRLGEARDAQGRSIWPAVHPRLLELVRQHRSTILFVNSRRLAERLAAALNELAGEELCRAHHGSIAREQRVEIEEALKAGRLPALVATSSLELGIDMGAVDLVIQIETPPSVASGLQRIGRAGHTAGAISRGVLFPKFRGDLLAVAALTRAMADGAVEETRVPQNPLDVLAQQLVSLAVEREWSVDELYALVRQAAPFARLPQEAFLGVLDLLSGRYPSEAFAELRPRLVWDRARGRVRARDGARTVAVTNAGTIPDRGLYGVYLIGEGDLARRRGGLRVGELDEEMVFESRAGEVFVLGASSWRIVEITRDRVLVEPAPGQPGKMPFWKADRGARPLELGKAIGRLTRELLAAPRVQALQRLEDEHFLEPRAAENLLAYLDEQRAATTAVPDDRQLVLERGRDELGDLRLCLLSPLGGRVHAPWALALAARLRQSGFAEAETLWSDDGIVIRLPDCDRPPEAHELLPGPDEIEGLVAGELSGTPLFAASFRECSARALLLPRRRPGQRTPLWMQRKRAHDLLQVAAQFPDFPMLLEAYRECLQDVFDLPALQEVARQVQERRLRLVTVDTQSPSPFAASLLFGYVANYLYEGDAPLHERRAQALAVDPRQLRELLGEAELRELLDPLALDSLEQALQAKDEEHRAKSADRLHDLLLRLGDLDCDEARARCQPAAAAAGWIETLLAEGRVIEVAVAGRPRLLAAEDAGRLRDALGVEPPPGLPEAFLERVPGALRELVSRYSRTHGPFRSQDVATRYGLGVTAVEGALQGLVASGRVLEGEFRPGQTGREWCEAEVLAALRRRSLAALRRAVEPAEPSALARLLLDWQGLVPVRAGARGGPDALLDVVELLQGAVVPASTLEREVLRARLPEYRPEDLDLLCAAGEIVWVGHGPLGERDGRVALYLADQLGPLLAPRPDPPAGAAHELVRSLLRARGASFFPELQAALGGMAREALDTLWDLIWAGEVVSDSPAGLRAFLHGHERTPRLASRRSGLFRSRRAAPPQAAGRFSLLAARLEAGPQPTPTQRAAALSSQLLARWGIVTRDAVLAEAVPGGFSALYPVLRGLEESGRIRRGYFVSGLGASQFAAPAALERLRALREGAAGEAELGAVVLSACDPAQPWGSLLPWPACRSRLARSAGAAVAVVDGQLTAFLPRSERELVILLPELEPQRSRAAQALARALREWLLRGRRSALPYETVDDLPIARSPLAPFLREAGFVPYGPGFRLLATAAENEPGLG